MTDLGDLVPDDGDPERVVDAFVEWVDSRGLVLYPAQEEALLELVAGTHVIVNTPTGSGKSLVALGAALPRPGRRGSGPSTRPRSRRSVARSSSRCAATFGAEHVGMLTGDASVNPDAPIICCTAEILANMALREGARARVD